MRRGADQIRRGSLVGKGAIKNNLPVFRFRVAAGLKGSARERADYSDWPVAASVAASVVASVAASVAALSDDSNFSR